MKIRFTGTNDNKSDNALIVFTREPEAGKTKTRLIPYFDPEKCAELHRNMIKDICREIRKTDADIVVAYTCEDKSGNAGEPVFLRSIFGRNALFIRQRGENIGSRMHNAINDVLGLGYKNAVLIGTDIPEIKAETIDSALALLAACDVVIGPTEDGGYYLIGMKAAHPEAFNVGSYGGSTVLDETVASLKKAGLVVEKADTYADIDTPDDLAGFRRRVRENAQLRKTYTGRFVSDNIKISVIVPVYNEADEISMLIRQLMPYSDECEVIIVDGGSTDNTHDLISGSAGEALCILKDSDSSISELAIRNDTMNGCRIFLLETEKGRAVQMNAGAQVSTGDVLFFLHCDSVLPVRFTNEIKNVMASYEWGCFRVKFPSRNLFMLTNRFFSNCRALYRKLPFGDQGIFIDRDVFFEAGMFPDIPLMEDYEFSKSMRCGSVVKGPGITRKRLITSARRYGNGTKSILRTEMFMWKLRYMYRHGVSADILQSMYDDIR